MDLVAHTLIHSHWPTSTSLLLFWRQGHVCLGNRDYPVLVYLGVAYTAAQLPGGLAYGRQKQLEFGRALMQKAKLVLLDEPMAGMSSAEKDVMTDLIKRVRAEMGVSFLLVEHDVPVIMDISDKIVVLDFGRKIAEGTPAQVQNYPAVNAANLGS